MVWMLRPKELGRYYVDGAMMKDKYNDFECLIN